LIQISAASYDAEERPRICAKMMLFLFIGMLDAGLVTRLAACGLCGGLPSSQGKAGDTALPRPADSCRCKY